MKPPPRSSADDTIMRIAARQHGVVARRQLLAAGVAGQVVHRRLQAGWLRPIHRGVYTVGPVLAPRAAEMAAVLACGDAAVVSHRAAALLWKLLQRRPSAETIDVTIRGTQSRRRPGIRIHRSRTMPSDDVTRLDGIPITTPERTLRDLASSARRRDVERAWAEALALRLTDPARMRTFLARHEGGRGVRNLRIVIDGGQPAFTRSQAEERFLDLVRRADIDPPAVNSPIASHEVDFLWRGKGLVAEIDGFAFHASRGAFERDRRRDAAVAAAGLRVMRVTWQSLESEPFAVVARLAQALAR